MGGRGCSVETDFLPLYITSVYKVLQHLLLIINLNLLAAQLYWLTPTKAYTITYCIFSSDPVALFMLQQTNFFWKLPLIWTLNMLSLLSHLTTFLKQGKTVPSVPGPGMSESSKLSKNWLKAISSHCKSYTIYIEYTPPLF